MFLQGMAQTIFLSNVPLFLILTGYLNLNKKISREYYHSMWAVLLSYLFISIITILYFQCYRGVTHSLVQNILSITSFSAINYAWYIEMWIGLFILTPFLNILWLNIESKKHKLVLIGTLYVLTALPDALNRYGVHLVPGYWEALYPCAFYFIGAYVRQYTPSLNKVYLTLFIFGCSLINPLFNIIAVSNHSMIHLVGDSNGIIGIPISAAIFILLYDVNFKNTFIQKTLTAVSIASLDMYLFSYMFDNLVYGWLKPQYFVSQGQFGPWFFIAVPLVFVCSFCAAEVKRRLFKMLHIPTK